MVEKESLEIEEELAEELEKKTVVEKEEDADGRELEEPGRPEF